MPFFMLHEVDDGGNIAMVRRSNPELDALSGEPLDAAAVELPVCFEVVAGEDGFYGQYDPDFEGGFVPRSVQERLVASYNAGSLMSVELVRALQALGVHNLQLFPAELRDAETGELLPWSYVFVNVLGRLSCATREVHPSPSGDGSWGPDRVVIHPTETRGLALFRLGETPSTIVVSERVAAVAADPRFRGLRAFPLESAEREGTGD